MTQREELIIEIEAVELAIGRAYFRLERWWLEGRLSKLNRKLKELDRCN